MENRGIFLGRLCPPHKGHERIINEMIHDVGEKNSLIIIGSSNIISDKVPFSYKKRKEWVNTLYPTINTTYLDDTSDEKWFDNLKSIILSCFGEIHNIMFYGGSFEDIYFFQNLYKFKIIDRQQYNLSGTDVRKNLELFGTTFKMVNDKIKNDVIAEWHNFKQRA